MSVHLQKEIEKLKKLIITEGTVVEESVTKAVSSIEKRDANLAQQVIKMDDKIDQLEVNLEEEGLTWKRKDSRFSLFTSRWPST